MGRFTSRDFIFQDENSFQDYHTTVDVLDASKLLSMFKTMRKNSNCTCIDSTSLTFLEKFLHVLVLAFVTSLLFCDSVITCSEYALQ